MKAPLSSIRWSPRALSFFSDAEIETVEQLAEKPASEIVRYRRVGKQTITEIRYQLGKLGLHLKEDKIHVPENIASDFEKQLAERKAGLEGELAIIENQIQGSKVAKWLEKLANKPVRERLDENAIYAAWKDGNSFTHLAKMFLSRPWMISEICWSKLEKDCAEGNPPILAHTIKKRIDCKNCKTTIVIYYRGEPRLAKCPRCRYRSKFFFK